MGHIFFHHLLPIKVQVDTDIKGKLSLYSLTLEKLQSHIDHIGNLFLPVKKVTKTKQISQIIMVQVYLLNKHFGLYIEDMVYAGILFCG